MQKNKKNLILIWHVQIYEYADQPSLLLVSLTSPHLLTWESANQCWCDVRAERTHQASASPVQTCTWVATFDFWKVLVTHGAPLMSAHGVIKTKVVIQVLLKDWIGHFSPLIGPFRRSWLEMLIDFPFKNISKIITEEKKREKKRENFRIQTELSWKFIWFYRT